MRGLALLALFFLLAANSAHAFVTTRAERTVWVELPSISVGTVTDDIGREAGVTAVREAAAEWSAVGVIELEVGEGELLVEWVDPWPPEFGVSATAITSTSTRGQSIVRATVQLNDARYRWTAGEDRDRHRAQVVLLHELGHALGLSHSTRRDAAMYWHYDANAQLTEDDRRGLRYLYGEIEPGLSCDSCTVPAECESGLCVTLGDGRGQCAVACGQGCPEQFECVGLGGGGDACVPRNQSCTDRVAGSLEEGVQCWGIAQCGPGLQCAVTPDDARCQTVCRSDDDCPEGLLCAQNDGGTLACGPPGPGEDGAGCVDPYECVGLRCLGNRCASPPCVDCDAGVPDAEPDAEPDLGTPDAGREQPLDVAFDATPLDGPMIDAAPDSPDSPDQEPVERDAAADAGFVGAEPEPKESDGGCQTAPIPWFAVLPLFWRRRARGPCR